MSDGNLGESNARVSRPFDRRWIWLGLCLVVLSPFLYALVTELCFGSRPVAGGDIAVLEILTRQVGAGQHHLGPYSRFFWNHPGPLYFYLLQPLYRLSGQQTVGLYWTAALISCLAAAGLAIVLLRSMKGFLVRCLALCLLSVFFADFVDRHTPTAFTEIWNPLVTVLPFGLFHLLCADLSAGRLRGLPLLVFLQAFLAQTHVGYVPYTFAALLLALALYLRRESLRRGLRRSWVLLVASAGLFLLLWAPVLVDALAGAHNLSAIARSFARQKLVFSGALSYLSRQLSAPWLQMVRGDHVAAVPSAHDWVAILVSACQVILLPYAYVRAQRRGLSFVAALCLFGVVGVLLGYLAVLKIEDRLYYITLWFGMLGTINWLAIVASFVELGRPETASRLARIEDRGRVATVLITVLPLAFLSFTQWSKIRLGYHHIAPSLYAEGEDIRALARTLSPLLRAAGAQAPSLGIRDHDAWPIFAGVLLQLDKDKVPLKIDEKWRFMFGAGFSYVPNRESSLLFGDRLVQDARLLLKRGRIHIYSSWPPSRPRNQFPSPANVTRTVDVRGEPFWVTDGAALPAGAPWDVPGALVLNSASSSVTVAVPRSPLDMLVAVADGNDSYLVEGSLDGASFAPIGVVPPAEGWGIRPRMVRLENRGPWSYLRLAPKQGDGHYSLSEVIPVLPKPSLHLALAVNTAGDQGWLTDGQAPADGSPWDGAGCLKLARDAALLFVLAPTPLTRFYVEGLRITADGNDAYLIEGSRDGAKFTEIGVLPAHSGWGLRTREFYFNDRVDWRLIRISPRSGDGSFSIAEVAPIISTSVLVDVGTPLARLYLREGWSGDEQDGSQTWARISAAAATSVLPGEPNAPGLVDVTLSPLQGGEVGSTVALEWNGKLLADSLLVPQLESYLVFVPGDFVREQNSLTLRLAPARGGKLGAAVHHVLLRQVVLDLPPR